MISCCILHTPQQSTIGMLGMQAQGMLTRDDDSGGGGEVLPFQQWSFSERSYVQYLTDLLGVHHVLEQALSEGTVVHGPDHYGELFPREMTVPCPHQGFVDSFEPRLDHSGLLDNRQSMSLLQARLRMYATSTEQLGK